MNKEEQKKFEEEKVNNIIKECRSKRVEKLRKYEKCFRYGRSYSRAGKEGGEGEGKYYYSRFNEISTRFKGRITHEVKRRTDRK